MTPRNRPRGRYGDCCRRLQGQPLPGLVAVGGDVTHCRSGQAEPTVDGTCVRKGVTGGARAPTALNLWNALVRGGSSGILGARLLFWSASRLTRLDGALRALSLWNALVRGGSSGILVGYPAHTGRRGTPARRRGPSVTWVTYVVVGAEIGINISPPASLDNFCPRGALGTRGGGDRASRLVITTSTKAPKHLWADVAWDAPCTRLVVRCSASVLVVGVYSSVRIWSGEHSLVWCPSRVPPILVGARSWDLAPWFGNRRSWWSARADVTWSCSGCHLRLARVFLGIDPSPTLVGIP
ncbi:hypothetical protein TIFTF001_056013, partial [Ficus carica]